MLDNDFDLDDEVDLLSGMLQDLLIDTPKRTARDASKEPEKGTHKRSRRTEDDESDSDVDLNF